MTSHIDDLVQRYRTRGVLVDTNILLLFFVGKFDRTKIAGFKRTRQYSAKDYDLLIALLREFNRMVTTPNILTEVSNLSGYMDEPDRSKYFATFAAFAKRTDLVMEEYVPSAEVCSAGQFVRLGLTDTGIACLVKDKYLVLTDDVELYQSLASMGIDTLNFAHFRAD